MFNSRLKDYFRLVFDKKAYMKEYNARPEQKQKVREAAVRHYWANKNNPDYLARKKEKDKRWRLSHLEYKRQKDMEYHWKNREKHLQAFKKKVHFLGKNISLGFNPRRGVCSICAFIGRTDLHHIKYEPSDPLAYTIELCRPCHAKMRIGMKYKVKSGGGCQMSSYFQKH